MHIQTVSIAVTMPARAGHTSRQDNRVFAIISDVHGNWEALETVLAEIDRRSIRTIFCLGDVVGYGASPRECLDAVLERTEVSMCGNHDHAVFYEPFNFNVGAERAAYWTRAQFEDEPNKTLRDRRWEFLGRLPVRYEYKRLLFVHGSPRRPVNEYLFAEDVYSNPTKLRANFDRLEPHQVACFVGHTHVPGVFVDDPYFDPPAELSQAGRYDLDPEEKVIINVGSVGQPRDRDPRSSFVVIHEAEDLNESTDPSGVVNMPSESPSVSEGLPKPEHDAGSGGTSKPSNGNFSPMRVEFVRIEYDIDKAVRKILAIPDLDDFLGNRLFDGR